MVHFRNMANPLLVAVVLIILLCLISSLQLNANLLYLNTVIYNQRKRICSQIATAPNKLKRKEEKVHGGTILYQMLSLQKSGKKISGKIFIFPCTI